MSSQKLEEAIKEKLRDKWWRLSNLYLIRDESAAIVPFVPRDEQIQFFHERHNRNYILKARKLGMSTLLVLDSLDSCIFEPGTKAAIVDRNEKEAQDKLGMAILSWDQGHKHPDKNVANVWCRIKEMLKLTSRTNGFLEFANGSQFEAGVSLRGGTPQRLHISELGYIASHDRKRAEEIQAGSINAVPQSGCITIETTHEGGKIGMSYEFAKLAMECTARGIETPLDWKFHFYPWFDHPSYTTNLERPRIEVETLEYFDDLSRATGRIVSPQRQAWYQAKKQEQREAMFREFPSTPDEAFRAQVSGAIYPHMMTLRATGKIKAFEPDPTAPLFTSWDIGMSDFTPIWLLQFVGRDILWLDWYENEGQGVAHYVNKMRQWEQQYGRLITQHFLPHDANKREMGTGKSILSMMIECGLTSHTLKVVPRTPDIWSGINQVRDILPRSWFHARCDQSRTTDRGEERLSGVGCLEAYHKQPPTASGVLREEPCHDESSHSSDAARTVAEALSLGMVSITAGNPVPKVKTSRPIVHTGLSSSRVKQRNAFLDRL